MKVNGNKYKVLFKDARNSRGKKYYIAYVEELSYLNLTGEGNTKLSARKVLKINMQFYFDYCY